MHSQLEQYLAEVAAELQELPEARRNEELHEIRGHLLHAVTVNREAGQSEDESLRTTLEQFGTPTRLGQNLFTTWQRGEARLDKRSYWGAAICVVVSGCVMALLIQAFQALLGFNLNPDLKHVTLENVHTVQAALFWAPIVGVTCITLSGFITGWVFPRKGVPATALSMTFLSVISCSVQFIKHMPMAHDAFEAFYDVIGILFNVAFMPLLAVLGAWAGRKLCTMPVRLMCDDQ